jgi:hypothetical protein
VIQVLSTEEFIWYALEKEDIIKEFKKHGDIVRVTMSPDRVKCYV